MVVVGGGGGGGGGIAQTYIIAERYLLNVMAH